MMFRKALLFILVIFFASTSLAAQEKKGEESDQQINEFSLSGYGDKGKKSWELAGKSADIFDDVVKLKDITGKLYGENENIKLTSDKGDFNKAEGKIHLQDNVVITTDSGATLTTDALDWDRKNQVVSTKEVVNIVRENMTTTGRGAYGEPNLKKVNLEKEVTLEIKPEIKGKDGAKDAQEKIVVTCDGPLEVDYEKNVAIFKNNVKVDRSDSQIYCDNMQIYFLKGASSENSASSKDAAASSSSLMSNAKIDKLICLGNVRIVRGENVSYSDEAIYTQADKKIILSGRPKVILYSTEDLKSASFGN